MAKNKKPVDNVLTDGSEPNPELSKFKISVRGLVSFSIPNDESWSFSSYRMAHEGTLAHSKLQAINREKGDYSSEVHLSHTFQVKDCLIELSGRADGIWNIDGKYIVHEIKTSATPLSEIGENFSEYHWAQGKCYALLLAETKELDEVTVRLTYYDSENNNEKSFDKTFSAEKLRKFIKSLLYPYATWALGQAKWKELRNQSIQNIVFPYPSFRKGQKLLSYNVFKCIEDSRRLFVQAPTGIGKTMGVLYPAIKSLAEGKIDRLFYLTAKTTTRGIAETAYDILTQQGLRLRAITLTAKDKLCLNDTKNCNPEKCPFIEGFQYRCKRVANQLLKKNDFFSREIISEAGLRHGICPFELSLELAMSCDLIICDYNYVFDPRVYLRRFFQQKGYENYLIMVDEAHNLYDRAREMYSASIDVKTISDVSKEIKKEQPEIYRTLRELKKTLTSLEKTAEEPQTAAGIKYYTYKEPPLLLKEPLEKFILATENWIMAFNEEESYTDSLFTLFFDLLHFKNVLDLYSPIYRTLLTGSKTKLQLSLLCTDPAPMLNKTMEKARSTILFSATLSPLWYFRNILGGTESDITLRLPSPFPSENLLVCIEDRIETRFSQRKQYLEATASAIHSFSVAHKGNIMVFFPSYKYMQDVLDIFKGYEGDFEIIFQDREMSEQSREEFLAKFEPDGNKTLIAFCVMGGVFGEGIDLKGDLLTGVIIIGVGLPQVSPIQEILRSYFQKKGQPGFTFAYTYPGINKVLQAAGRLIRSEEDRGALLLIDSRFSTREYQSLLPEEWQPIPRTSLGFDLKEEIYKFWSKN
ncbi:MAG: ATP-dependent DNA helicase [Clostridiaceae bacterium]|mgnify:CR=1 FL=1|nr:ATP-dependent DNA helicase [Clostridiaceae bacterium]